MLLRRAVRASLPANPGHHFPANRSLELSNRSAPHVARTCRRSLVVSGERSSQRVPETAAVTSARSEAARDRRELPPPPRSVNDISLGTRALQVHQHSTAARAVATRAEEGKHSGACHHNDNCGGDGVERGAVANDPGASRGDVTQHRDPVVESASDGNRRSRGWQRTPPSPSSSPPSPSPSSSSSSAPSSTTHGVPRHERQARAPANGVLNAIAHNPTTETFDAAWDLADKKRASRSRALVAGGLKASKEASMPRGGGELDDDPRDKDGEVGPTGERRAHKMWVTNSSGDNSVSEHQWDEADRMDHAVIQFHSQEDSTESPFQGYGVITEDKADDIQTMVDGFTAPALAAALRDRETALHVCARLLEEGDLASLRRVLSPFTAQQVAESRRALRRLELDPAGFTTVHMYTLKKVLQRLPRHVTTLRDQRASVMIPLCNVDGVASVLFTKRSGLMRAHKNEVCFPGGKVDIGVDQHIIHTALREMGEEIGIAESSVDVLGVLRCDWSEVASLVGVAVTPVVGFLGDLSREQINPNPSEVSHCFTIPIRYLLRQERWKLEKYKAPAFVGGPYVIWGLTGYILHRLVNDVFLKHLVIV